MLDHHSAPQAHRRFSPYLNLMMYPATSHPILKIKSNTVWAFFFKESCTTVVRRPQQLSWVIQIHTHCKVHSSSQYCRAQDTSHIVTFSDCPEAVLLGNLCKWGIFEFLSESVSHPIDCEDHVTQVMLKHFNWKWIVCQSGNPAPAALFHSCHFAKTKVGQNFSSGCFVQ